MEKTKYLNLKIICLTCITTVTCMMLFTTFTPSYISRTCSMDAIKIRDLKPFDVKVTVDHKMIAPDNNASDTKHRLPGWDYNWDKREGRRKGQATRTLVLIRHGKYNFDTGKLTNIGMEQARTTGKRLQSIANISKQWYSSLHHSSMTRAKETADIIAKEVNVTSQSEMDSMLMEGGPIKPEPTISYWSLPDDQYHLDGPRLEAAFRKYFYRADITQTKQSYHLIIAHSNIIRYFLLRSLQLDPSAWMRLFISHGSITKIHCNSDGTVNSNLIGDSGFFPADLVTY